MSDRNDQGANNDRYKTGTLMGTITLRIHDAHGVDTGKTVDVQPFTLSETYDMMDTLGGTGVTDQANTPKLNKSGDRRGLPGLPKSPEHKAKIRASHLGYKPTESARRLMSESAIRAWKYRKQAKV